MERLGKYEGAGRLLTVVYVGLSALLLGPMAVSAASVEYVSQGLPLFRFEVPDDWQFRIGPDVPAPRCRMD